MRTARRRTKASMLVCSVGGVYLRACTEANHRQRGNARIRFSELDRVSTEAKRMYGKHEHDFILDPPFNRGGSTSPITATIACANTRNPFGAQCESCKVNAWEPGHFSVRRNQHVRYQHRYFNLSQGLASLSSDI